MTLRALLVLAAFTSPAFAEEPKAKKLTMQGHDAAVVRYADKCPNGNNITKPERDAFIKAMLADPKSKLGKLKAQVLTKVHDEIRDEIFFVSDGALTYHDRDGCADNHNAYSFFVYTIVGGNTDHTVTHALMTIDDDDASGERTLRVRSITPLKVRDETFPGDAGATPPAH